MTAVLSQSHLRVRVRPSRLLQLTNAHIPLRTMVNKSEAGYHREVRQEEGHARMEAFH